MSILYTANATNTGGRNGHSKTDDGRIDVAIRPPEEVSADDKTSTNPEQLFAAAYSACYHGALRLVLERARVSFADSRVTAAVHLMEDPSDNGLRLAVEMKVHVDGVDEKALKRYIALAHTVCPYSKALNNGIDITDVIE